MRHDRGRILLAFALRAGPAQWQRSLLRGGGKKALPKPCLFLSPSLCPRERTSRAAVPLRRRRPSKRAVPPPLRGNGGVRPIRASPPPPAEPWGSGGITRGVGVGGENGGHVLSRPPPGPGLAEGRDGLRRTPGRQWRVAALFREGCAVPARAGVGAGPPRAGPVLAQSGERALVGLGFSFGSGVEGLWLGGRRDELPPRIDNSAVLKLYSPVLQDALRRSLSARRARGQRVAHVQRLEKDPR